MCGYGYHNWLLGLSLLVVFGATTVASIVFVARELGRPRRRDDER